MRFLLGGGGASEGRVPSKFFTNWEGQTWVILNRGRVTVFLARKKLLHVAPILYIQSTPDNSNLQGSAKGNQKKVRVIGSSSYREFKENSRNKGKQEDARRRLRGMCWCKNELPLCWMAMESWVVYATNVCRRDEDVLLRTNTLDDELHTRVPLLLKTKLTSILPPYMLRVWDSSLKFVFLY